jgi:hypothetical protein
MKTPLQELMQWFNERPQYDKTSEGYEIMQKAQELLAKEKEQIIDAYENGVGDENERNLSGKFTCAELYYNQTYNNERRV